MPTVDPDRRRLVAGGAVATAALWAAPSVTTFDRVAAATGSCGIAPVCNPESHKRRYRCVAMPCPTIFPTLLYRCMRCSY